MDKLFDTAASSKIEEKAESGKLVLNIVSIKCEVPKSPEGYAFMGEKLKEFRATFASS